MSKIKFQYKDEDGVYINSSTTSYACTDIVRSFYHFMKAISFDDFLIKRAFQRVLEEFSNEE